MNQRVRLFGVEIDAVRMTEAVDRVLSWVREAAGPCRFVVTPNTDHAVMLQEHNELRAAYADASLVLADGAPVVVASKLLRRRVPERVAGSDLAPALFEGMKRPFLDESDVLADVIAELAAASERRRGNRLRDVFLTELATEMESAGRRAGEAESALSPREQEVLRFLIQGRSNREIADAMDLSINTVKFHMKNIFGKLGANSRKNAVSVTIRRRLL